MGVGDGGILVFDDVHVGAAFAVFVSKWGVCGEGPVVGGEYVGYFFYGYF